MATIVSYGRKQQWRNDAIAKLVKDLTQLGEDVIQYVADHPEGYEHQKYNLYDSISSAVYVDGQLDVNTIRYASINERSTEPYLDRGERGSYEMMTGRDAVENYWDTHRKKTRNAAVELVCVAAVYYSGILEARGVKVISAITDYLENCMGRYKSYSPKLMLSSEDKRL